MKCPEILDFPVQNVELSLWIASSTVDHHDGKENSESNYIASA